MVTLQERFKEIREAHGLSQKQMADKVGIAASSWNGYERGKITPSLVALEKICEALGLTSLEFEGDYEIRSAPEKVTAKEASPVKDSYEAPVAAVEEKEDPRKEEAAPKPAKEKPVSAARKEKKVESLPPAKKTPQKAPSRPKHRKDLKVLIQSSAGGEISVQDVRAKVLDVVPTAECIYVKPDENRAYWTKGTSNGSVMLWD